MILAMLLPEAVLIDLGPMRLGGGSDVVAPARCQGLRSRHLMRGLTRWLP